jgi:hypothetical protein
MSEDQQSDATEPESDESSDTEGSESFEGSDDPKVISDDQLPEDLRPTDDNPLAKPPGEDDGDDEGGMNLQEQAEGAPPA